MTISAEKLPIFRDTYCLTQDIMSYTAKFSRDYKFMLGTALNQDALDLCMLVFMAIRHTDRELVFEQYMDKLERIRLQLRLCADFRLLSFRQQADLAKKMENLTTQVIAWKRSERRKHNITHQETPCRNQE